MALSRMALAVLARWRRGGAGVAVSALGLGLVVGMAPVVGQETQAEAPAAQQDRRLVEAEQLNQQVVELYQQGRYGEAVPLAQRVLELRESSLGENHPDVATSLNNLALLYKTQGNYVAAEPLYQRSLNIYETALGENHPNVATSLNNLAALYHNQDDIAGAIASLRAGLAVEEINLAQTLAIGSEARKQAYIDTTDSTKHRAISLHQQAAPTNPNAAHLALTTTLRRKGRILDAVTNNVQRLRQNLPPEELALLDDYTTLQTQLAALLYGGLGQQDPEAYRAQVEALREESDRLENELAQRSAEFRIETAPVDIEALQASIPTDGVLIELVRYEPFNPKADRADRWGTPRYAAYLLHPDGTIHSADLGDAATIDTAIDAYLIALQRPYALDSSAINQSSRALEALVMQPIRPMLSNAQHLLIAPDGQLNLIPFAALMDEDGQYLTQRHQITHLTTGRDLLKLQLNAPSRQSPTLLANPNYDQPGNPSTTAIAPTSPLSSLGEGPGERASEEPRERGSLRSEEQTRAADLTTLKFGPLPGTQTEADAIAPLFPDLTLLTQSNATENALKQLDAPSILHIATHGFFLEDVEFLPPQDTRSASISVIDTRIDTRPRTGQRTSSENPLLRSGLALAGFNPRQSGSEDGVLTALEASQLNLYGTDLVVLSACETGVGDVANGEGVYGLRRAFVIAGAESLMMSLWQVSDDGTAELMTRYYQRLQSGQGRSEALRETQLELMQTPGYDHPYYWASFIFSGDWRSLEQR